MSIKNSKKKYGNISIILHWLMALLIVVQIPLGVYMADLPIGVERGVLFNWHKEIGLSILILVILRVIWRLSNVRPLLPKHMPYWQQLAAHTVHFLFYVGMFALPLTGWVLSSAFGFPVSFFGLFVMPDLVAPDQHLALNLLEVHEWLAFGTVGLLILHVGAVFYHLIFYRYNILKRILP